MSRKRDIVRIESDGGRFDAFESLEIVNDIAGISEANFTVGDDGAWPDLRDIVAPGQPFRVYCNEHLRMTGRAEVNEVPGDLGSGIVLNLTCRTKMSDARYSSAATTIKLEGKSLKQVILDAYAVFGLAEGDFVFGEFTDVDIMTGRSAKGKAPFDPDPITPDKAKVQPPETVYEFVERHLKRYRATHWDGPDGKIMVGRPDDQQAPLYRLMSKRGKASVANNVVGYRKIRDWTEVPATVVVHGRSVSTGDDAPKPFRSTATDTDAMNVALATGHFNRSVLIQDQQSRNAETASRTAQRELSARIRRKDAWEVQVDGWSYWDGTQQIDWAINTVADIDIDAIGGVQGPYLIVRTGLRYDLSGAATTSLTVVAPGVWTL